jgi:hypothetical protein
VIAARFYATYVLALCLGSGTFSGNLQLVLLGAFMASVVDLVRHV